MPEPPVPSRLSRIWSRRWVRRLTYLLASGASLAGLAGFLVTRPQVDHWIVQRLDLYLREETGLAFQAERLEVQPFRGRFVLHQFSLGGDLLTAERLEVDLELGSLLRQPHLRKVVLVSPHLLLDEERLGRLRLKSHPPAKDPLKVRLDSLEIRDGQARLGQPAWGLPAASCTFQATGKGWIANQVWLDLRMPSLELGTGAQTLRGDLRLNGNLSDQNASLEHGDLRLGANHLAVQGSYAWASRILRAAAHGHLDLPEAQRLAAPKQPPAATGQVEFSGQAEGSLSRLAWRGSVLGKDLHAPALPLHPGTLQLQAWGNPGQLSLDKLHWESTDGTVAATGGWTRKDGTSLDVQAQGIRLAPVAGYTRTGFLKDLIAQFQGKLNLPSAPWQQPDLAKLTFQGSGRFLQDGEQVGGMEFTIANSRLQTTELDLDLPEIEFHGTASAQLAKRGLASLQADGEVRTDASDVAAVLQVWDIGSRNKAGKVEAFDMEGMAHTRATFSWTPSDGMHVLGHAEIKEPRWHGARADRISAEVSIERDVLRLSDIQLDKGAGSGAGEIWLTWAKLPPGSETLDMCYRAFRLPIREGLRAADQGLLRIDGTGTGWVRLHGPYDHLVLEGRAVAEGAEVYGLKIPAASTDFFMDLAENRLKALDARVADTLEHLAHGADAPSGPLALQGSMDMDIRHERWLVNLEGNLDSQLIGLPGPHLQAWVETRLDGPLTAPFGTIDLPTGTLTFTRGRLTQGLQTLGGLEGSAAFQEGRLAVSTGLSGMNGPIFTLEALQVGPHKLAGGLRLDLSSASADTAALATQLSDGFLKDATLDCRAQGEWSPEGLTFRGSLEQITGDFDGFQLVQARPGKVQGNATGADLNLELEARTQGGPLPGGAGAGIPSITGLGLQGWLPFSSTGPLALKLAGSAELANLKTIFDHLAQPGQYSLLSDMRPGGTARIDLNLGGSLQEASLDGTLQVKDGRVSVRTYPQSVENVDFTARFQGRDIVIPESEPLRGTLAQGAVKAWGQVTWQLGGLSRYDLHGSIEDFQFRDLPEGFELQGSLDATLKGSDQDGGLLKGSLWAKRMLYRADFNIKDILLANAFGSSSGLNGLDPSDPLARIDLDLELHLGEPWEFDTNLLKLQGRPQGTFKVLGTLAQPGLKGKMTFTPGGRVTNLLPAGDIVLERGVVEFKDPTSFNPNIDIQGRVDVPPYLVNLAITGTLDSLQAVPTSTPSLRQDEIFTILVDPSAAASLGSAPTSSSQALMNTGLANTGTGLLSSLALANFQEGLRKTLNLDRVSVAFRSGVGTTETSVLVGKSFNVFGARVPLVFTHHRAGETTTISGQLEWRFGSFVLQGGFSQSTGDIIHPAGEIRHTWSPK